jgi:biotin carboxylase
VFEGAVECVHVARKRLGFGEHFEEVDHLIAPWDGEPWAAAVRELVELNGRLGGDLIPYVGRLATGNDLVVAAAELSLGRRPAVLKGDHRAAEIRFLYPPHDGELVELDVAPAWDVPGVEHVVALSSPGSKLRLPPHGLARRFAAVVAVGADEQACSTVLDAAERAVVSSVR